MATKEQYAYWCLQLVDGDDIYEELFSALNKDGYTDEEGFWIYAEEEDS